MGKKTIGQLEAELKALKSLRKAQEDKAKLQAKRDALQREVNLERRRTDPKHRVLRKAGKIGKKIGKSKAFGKAKKRFLSGPGDIF